MLVRISGESLKDCVLFWSRVLMLHSLATRPQHARQGLNTYKIGGSFR
jgi:hypothetical protein